MKKKMNKSTVVGIVLILIATALIGYFGYRVVAKSGEMPGKLVSMATSAENVYFEKGTVEAKTIADVQKVDFDTMKYGYLDQINLAQMASLDAMFDGNRMEEVRAKNDLTAMENWSSDLLAYEEFKAQQEKDAKEAQERAEAAAKAAEEARKQKVQQITSSILNVGVGVGGEGFVNVGGSLDLGSGATATNGGAIGPPVYADHVGASLGIFDITAYCTCRVCCGIYSGMNHTASGTVPTSNRTLAVDRNLIPFGTRLVINGQVYVAEDVGGAIKGKHIDMFFYTHAEAIRWGKRSMEVYYYD